MKELTFIHLSDPHVLAPNKQLFVRGVNTETQFFHSQKILLERETNAAFTLISGDLIHDGDETDYRHLKKLLDDNATKSHIPYMLALGNHDTRCSFRSVFLQEKNSNRAYYHSTTIRGIRFIVLDSMIPGKVEGTIDEEQLEWLENLLKTEAKAGTVIIMHHPPVKEHFKNKEQFGQVIKNTDVIGILSGHIHRYSQFYFNSIPCFTVNSTAYGMVKINENITTTTKQTGYNIVTVKNKKLFVQPQTVTTDKPYLLSV